MSLRRRWTLVLLVVLFAGAVVSLGGVPVGDLSPGDRPSDLDPGWSVPEILESNGSPTDAASATESGGEAASGSASESGTGSESTSGSETSARSGLNESRVELLVHEAVNEYRVDAGRSPLEYDPALGEIADYHSENMAADGRIYHRSPSGEDFRDRYDRFDYDCRVPAEGNRYYVGGENVAQTWYEVPLRNGDRHDTPEELADGIAEQWYDSEDHRENMLMEEWRRQGIGIEVTEVDGNVAIYATQNFC